MEHSKLENKKFILIEDLKSEAKEFENKLNVAKQDISKVIKAITIFEAGNERRNIWKRYRVLF